MKLSTKGRYAVTAMMELAVRDKEGPVTLSEISAEQGISISYLEQLFARLRRNGLVRGMRGPGGGYRLAKKAAEITVAEIITAVDEKAYSGGSEPGVYWVDSQAHRVQKMWRTLSGRIFAFLDGLTLAEVIEQGQARTPPVAGVVRNERAA